ncbi:MFS transporter [Salinadaptatus halalkaliphilus]|uniref:MFS transporter n=1 Tax=Salinadaptatus halalkaliphilus TaxID=2419781 RepID=A0A4S3TKP4_9EURY|nr:MFS transporter [Salinadaptatus halalkaliphilus]THE63813.1 MFS transporter [Salinadaptatus halalkaliphilus]
MDGTATDESNSRTIPWDSGTFYVILSSSLMGVMGVSLISPVLPQLQAVFDVSDAQIGLVITAYTLPGVFLTPFIGLIADRIGRRRVIIPLLFIFGAAGAGMALATSFTELLALRFLQGIGASALVTLAVTLIGDVYEGGRQNAVMGVNSSMLGTGAALYPLIGGGLAGIRWNVPFLFFGVGILVGVFALVVLPEPDGQQSTDVRTYIRRLRDVSTDPQAAAIFVAIFVIFFVFYGAVQTALPLLLSDEFALTSGEIGVTLSMVAVASATVSSQYGRISQWRTAPELVALGFVAYGISLLGLWIAPSPIFVGLSLLAFGVGFGIVMPSVDTTIVTLVSNRLRAGMMGMRTSVLRLGQTLGPVAFTFLAETAFETSTTGYRTLILGFGLLILASGLLAYPFLRR